MHPTTEPQVTFDTIASTVNNVHPDKTLQMINALPHADLVVRDRVSGKEIKFEYFNRGVALTRGPATYCQDGLCTVVDSSFMQDPKFLEAYRTGREANKSKPGGMDIHWRVYNECWVANKVKDLEGDFVECGVKKGGSVMPVMTYIDFPSTGKNFWLLDTFEGIAMELLTEEEKRIGIGTNYNRDFDNHYEYTKNLFEPYDCVKIIKGRVPDTLHQVEADKICYLLIDMNNAAPEIAAIEYFWDKLVSGAIVILDDYAWKTHPVQKVEFDRFAERKGIEILSMPTGQGFIFKP